MNLLQYAGDPIDCWDTPSGVSDTMIDNWCWVKGTYTKYIPGRAPKGHFDKYCEPDDPNTFGSCWHHEYYQWVALVILLQAGCFYTPRYCTNLNFPGMYLHSMYVNHINLPN